MKNYVLRIIRFYQKSFSFDYGLLGKLFPNTRVCRFSPSCSQYTYESVKKHGVWRGMFLGVKRIIRCNTLLTPVTGTYDPVT